MSADASPIQRRSRRKTERIPVTLLLKNQGRELERSASTVDLSDEGLRVQTTAPLSEGQIVYVISGRGYSPLGYCRVVWVRESDLTHRNEAGLKVVN
ncbi:MAG: PilZ domain-containing protein [Acidobacteria bacterium]|nr:PilZ domain-containing protein [Acidobacteriota bacterium]